MKISDKLKQFAQAKCRARAKIPFAHKHEEEAEQHFNEIVSMFAKLQKENETLMRRNYMLCELNDALNRISTDAEFEKVKLRQLLANINLAIGDGSEGINYDELGRLMNLWEGWD